MRDFEFDDFAAAMAFVNAWRERAEAANHHPDILVHGWNKVRLTLSTHHSEGGLTEADFGLADAIDALPARASGRQRCGSAPRPFRASLR